MKTAKKKTARNNPTNKKNAKEKDAKMKNTKKKSDKKKSGKKKAATPKKAAKGKTTKKQSNKSQPAKSRENPYPVTDIQKVRCDSELKSFQKSERVAKIVLDRLSRQGKFYNDGCQTYFFSKADKELIRIDPKSTECVLLLGNFGFNRTEKIYEYLVAEMWRQAMTRGTETTVHRLSFYDRKTFTLYVSNGGHQVYRITPEKVRLVDNGTDGVLFISDSKAKPFKVKKPKRSSSLLEEILLSGIKFADGILTAAEKHLVLTLWFYSLFFREIMPTRPILLLLGPKGSAKTTTARKMGVIIIGRGFNVMPLTKDSKDFDAAITNSAYVAVDNADAAPPWFEDRLAVVATGGSIKKRLLFSTNEEGDFPICCFMAVTSRMPSFRRDDVTDGLLIVKLRRRRGKFIPESDLMNRVLEQRDEIMSEIIYALKDILRALRDSKVSTVDFRMADFGVFALKIGIHRNKENEVKTILAKLESLQREFHLESDPIAKLLLMWAGENPDRELTAAVLNNRLAKLAEQKNIPYPYKGNSRSLAQKLKSLRKEFEGVLNITDRTAHGGIKKYRIRPEWSKTKKGGGKGGM